MQKWEYHVERILKVTSDLQGRLNTLGEDGWEFVVMLPSDEIAWMLFKRPKQ